MKSKEINKVVIANKAEKIQLKKRLVNLVEGTEVMSLAELRRFNKKISHN